MNLLMKVISPELVAQKIEQSYNPKIEFDLLGAERDPDGCVVENFQIVGQDPIHLKNRPVHVSVYRPKININRQEAVIILPPTGGVNILDRGYASELCSSGLTVALISDWEYQNEVSLDFSMHNKGAFRALAATRHVIEFLQGERFEFIGLLGTSIGAVAGVLVLGFEPRVSSAALIVGSGHFAEIIAKSDESGTTKLRRQRMKTLGLHTDEDYRKAVYNAIQIEPYTFIGYTGKKRSLVISADSDTTVPSQDQFELARLLDAETHIRLPGNHAKVIKDSFCQHRKDIVNFFLPNLKGVS